MKTLTRHQDIQVFDTATLDSPEMSREGFLRCPVNATRSGIFVYYDEKGQPIRALRDEEEVFKPASMATLKGKPITRTHPSNLLDAASARGAVVGATGDVAERVGDFLRTMASLFDQPTIAAVQDGKQQVSCGYLADVVDEPGVHPKYGPYDVRQTNIRYNHLAVAIDEGRGGPNVRMLLDSASLSFKQEHPMTPAEQAKLDAEEKAKKEKEAKEGMTKITLGDEEHEVTPKLAEAVKGHIERMAGEHEKAHNELAKQIKGLSGKKKAEDDEMEGLAEANEGEEAQDAAKAAAKMDSLTIASPIATRYRKLLGKLQGTIQGLRTQVATKMDAASPKAIADAAKTQAKLVAVVVALSKEHKDKASELFLMDAADLKKLAIKARDPKAVLDGKSADYVDGQYEAVAAGVQINVGLTLGDALLGNADAAIAEQAAIKDKNTTKKWVAPPLTANKPGAFPAADKK